MRPACPEFVPGYGATDGDFHVIGNHPGVHGGHSTGVPFTEMAWSDRFFGALAASGLLSTSNPEAVLDSPGTFFSYLHMCVPEPATETPSEQSYREMEPYFDAELRAITAHVLLPVGSKATEHVLRSYSAIDAARAAEMDDLHATELRGSGWLILPIKDPAEWTDSDERQLVKALDALLSSDYQQISDLGRFIADSDPYFVR